jgi:thymidine phosphorylase
MNNAELIRKKRQGQELSCKELSWFMSNYLNSGVADEQMAAFLMASFLNGLTDAETASLTEIMRDSGRVMRWPNCSPGSVVDKHSTGGIGDKTSLIILPLVALESMYVPMIAGRGLGHTGGTLDKLESLKDIRLRLSESEAQKIVMKYGGAFLGQSDDLAPLDRRLYALRDVTATVESIPLITASILSKKAAEGISGLVMDVKCGQAAFMETKQDAINLAQSLKRVAHLCGIQMSAFITNMDEPLGDSVGNAVEVAECLRIMQGQDLDNKVAELSLVLATEMVHFYKSKESRESIKQRLTHYLKSGKAYELFMKIVVAQGATIKEELPTSKHKIDICAPQDGWIQSIATRQMGLLLIEMGGGRKVQSDTINHAVGFTDLVKVGQKVVKNEILCRLHMNHLNEGIVEAARSLFSVSDSNVQPQLLILEHMV